MNVRPLAALLAAAVALAGCVAPGSGDVATPQSEDAAAAPVPLPEAITALEPVTNVPFGGGNDVAFSGRYVFVSAGSGLHVVDSAAEGGPREIAVVDCNGKDVGVVELPDGRRIVTISSQADDGCPDAAPTGGIRLVDATDPTRPVVGKQVPLRFGSHTHTPYGNTGIVYNSAYNLVNPMDHHRSEIVDVSNPDDPKVVGEFAFPPTSKSHGCHDVLAEPERDRAICAGITETMIWDTTDPLAPSVVSTITDPLINIHHSAATARDGDLLILGDEWAGVLVPGCAPREGAPNGALWFYDISDPASPERLGFFPPPPGAPGEACTAHNFNVVEGRDLVVAAFYTGGTSLVDFSDPASPKLVAHWSEGDTNAWASYYHAGRVFVGDLERGLDVLALG